MLVNAMSNVVKMMMRVKTNLGGPNMSKAGTPHCFGKRRNMGMSMISVTIAE
jgi:hypothetical protein